MAERSSLVRLKKEYDIDIDWRGYELHPETPPGGQELSDLFPASRIPAMVGHVKKLAADFGLPDMNVPLRHPNTRRALAVAEYARDEGKLDVYRDLAMDGYWRHGLDLENDEDLRRIAKEAGLDPERAVAASKDPAYLRRIDERRQQAGKAGVTGIPTFLFGPHAPGGLGKTRVVGCQPYEILARAAEQAGAKRHG